MKRSQMVKSEWRYVSGSSWSRVFTCSHLPSNQTFGHCMLQAARSFCHRKRKTLMPMLPGLLCKSLLADSEMAETVSSPCDRTGLSPHSLNRLATPTSHFPDRAVRCCLDGRNIPIRLFLGERANRSSPGASGFCEFLADGVLDGSGMGCSNRMGYTCSARRRQSMKWGQADEVTRAAGDGASPRESLHVRRC
jgi:hypothetical protein